MEHKQIFKVGDWITNGKLLVGRVTSFDGEYYHYMCNGLEQPLHVSNAHKWHICTIEYVKSRDLCKTCEHYRQNFPLPLTTVISYCDKVYEKYGLKPMDDIVPFPCLECPFNCYKKK